MFKKGELRKLLKSKQYSSMNDVNSFLKEISKEVIEVLLEEELTSELGYESNSNSKKSTLNRRNGHSKKTVNSKFGDVSLDIPRDRTGDFEPAVVKKHSRNIDGLEDKVISLYARGMSVRDIQDHLEELYGYNFSPETISNMTNKVIEKAKEWQNRPLQSVYPIVFLDALVFKVRKDGVVKNTAVYTMIGIDMDGKKECLGFWFSENETSKYWLMTLNEIKNRGVKDVFIFSVDGLKGFNEAIQSAFPNSEIQKCIVHQLRNSLKHVSYKDRKAIAKDLKLIYKASTEDLALHELEKFEEQWNRYSHIAKSWRNNWIELATMFKYPEEIRRLIYTTNYIENYNRSIRKFTKNKLAFNNNDSLFKSLYLSMQIITKKWTMSIRNWPQIYSQLSIFFEERIK